MSNKDKTVLDTHNIVSAKQFHTILTTSIKKIIEDPSMAKLLPPTMCWGSPGCGKSSIVKRVADELGIGFIDFRLSQREPVDLKGLPVPNKETNTVSVIAAGWDPGSDSIVRTLMQSLAPKGLSYTNFGPGMSMGHSVCVRSKEGVKNALSMTIPLGEGIHRRMVYVELEDGAKLEEVTKAIKADPYFASDETHVFQVESVDDVRDMGHGVNLVRKGVSGKTQNQRLEFNMSINNPALTGQVLVNVARASMRLEPGCYTMIEIPVIDMLPGDRADLVEHLV